MSSVRRRMAAGQKAWELWSKTPIVAGRKPQWVKPPASQWDYTIFGERRLAPKPDDVIPLVIRRAGIDKAGFERWTINGKHYDAALPPTRLTKGRAPAPHIR